ncbi:hypothetical protein ACQ4WX_13400 [Streptomyces lasalocidi]
MGAATAVAAVGALLALTDSGSPLRGPCTLFFLLAAPAAVGRGGTARAGSVRPDARRPCGLGRPQHAGGPGHAGRAPLVRPRRSDRRDRTEPAAAPVGSAT